MLSDKSWRAESMFRLGLWLFGCLLLGLVVSILLPKTGEVAGGDSIQQLIFGTLIINMAIFPLVHLFLREQQMTWRSAFGFGSPQLIHTLLLAVGVAVVAIPVAWQLNAWSGFALQQMGAKPVPQSLVIAIQNSNELAPQIVRGVFAIVVAPPAEEILFRGILYPFFKQIGHPRFALWGTALLFGAIHGNQLAFAALVFLGVVLAWLYERTGNLLAPILVHSLFNLANFALLVLGRA